jgi:hypothetical protein
VDSSDSSRVKSARGHHHRGVAPEGATRATTDRRKDRKHPLYRCSGRTYLGNRLSPSSWPIDSQNRGRDRTELESNPQLLNAPEGKEIPVWLSQLRQSSRGSGGKKKAERPESETEIRSRLAREVEVLRRCTDWLQRLERGENVVVNLRPDEDVETEIVAFDRPRVVRVLERIAADLDSLSLVPNDPHADKESNHHDPRARHRHELAEPPPKPKKLSHREQRTALRAALGLPPQ